MKTPANRTAAWLSAVVMTVLTGGCVEPKGSSTDLSTNASSVANVGESAVSTNVEGVAAESAEPAALRAGRATRTFPDDIANVIALVEAGAGEEVARAYVERSMVPYELTLEDVLYLRDIGVPDGVVAAMMRRGAELRLQQAEVVALQTNLVSAVEDIKAALAAREGPEPGSVGAPSADVASGAEAQGPAPLPQATAAVPADAPSEVQPFYESLNPYGSWYQVPSYGWVWQPSVVVVDSGWAPYRHGGRWVWSDWGWYWSSEYSWGWAPFHYGRWATYPGLGWCWAPGTVWGPSWVTWRSHGSYVGWAPLPPHCGWSSGIGLTWYGSGISVGFGFGLGSSHYTFVPYGNFCHRNVHHHAVGRNQVNAVYNNSTVVNNVINGNNNTIVNNGVGYQAVASRSRSEIPKARIEPLPESVSQPVRVDRMERTKDGLVVYRPTPVSEAGGRPTAFRSEARPSSPAASAQLAPSRSASGVPSRPGYTSRFAPSTTSSTAKPMEVRGTPRPVGATPMTAPSATSARPMASPARTPSVSRTPVAGQYGSTPKRVDGRSVAQPQGRSAVPYSSPGAVLGPSRQTTPVPLADPSRYLPRSSVPAPRTATPSVAPAKPATETRGAVIAPSAPTAPSRYAPRVQSAPLPARPSVGGTYQATPRGVVPQSAPKVNYSRPAAGGYSVPSPVRAPMSAPRPSYSAPSPVMSAPSAPRPSFSAPSPAMSAPRPSFSAPAPAAGRPSAARPSPAGRSAGTGGGGGRTQSN